MAQDQTRRTEPGTETAGATPGAMTAERLAAEEGTPRAPTGGNGSTTAPPPPPPPPPPPGPTFGAQRSVGQMTSQLIDNLTLIVEKQIDLAKQEARETVQSGINIAKMFGPAAAFALLFVMALVNLLIAVVAIWLPLWLSALIFTVIFLIIAAVLGYIGYKRLMKALENPMGNTIESLQEDVEWAQRQVTPGER